MGGHKRRRQREEDPRALGVADAQAAQEARPPIESIPERASSPA